jgi:hyperosmotically inducible periplasmic protein
LSGLEVPMRTLLRLMLLVVLVLGAVWLVRNMGLGPERVNAEGALKGAAAQVEKAVSDIDLKAIAEELKQTGRVIRRKAGQAARKLEDATEDGRTTAAIKARLALDPSLSALDISVDTTDGRVTLAGKVNTPEDVARAMQIALEQENVSEVVSTLQVRALREGGSGPKA